MYSPQLCAIRRNLVEAQLARSMPHGLREYTVAEVEAFKVGFQGLFDKKGHATRRLSPRETAFIQNEQILSKIDYRYFAERYWTVNLAGQALGPLFPLWESQELVLEKIAELEWSRYESSDPEGLIADILKGRQMGISTLTESIIGHRLVTHANINGLLASDVPDNSNFLYDMYERGVDHLPFYMKPTITERVKNDEMVFGTGSRLMMAASKSTRGADKNDNSGAGKKGQMGRGKTVSMVHLTELATWTNPDQIDTALEPGIPQTPQTLWIKESTAQGRGPSNWWHSDWQNAKRGRSRSIAIFIGWYAEKSKNRRTPPAGWIPLPETQRHAKRIEETSPRWMNGRSYVCSRDQLFWYESTKLEKMTKPGGLEKFLQEYPADDEEAFQFSGMSVFPILIRERVKDQARPLAALVDVVSHRDLGMVR